MHQLLPLLAQAEPGHPLDSRRRQRAVQLRGRHRHPEDEELGQDAQRNVVAQSPRRGNPLPTVEGGLSGGPPESRERVDGELPRGEVGREAAQEHVRRVRRLGHRRSRPRWIMAARRRRPPPRGYADRDARSRRRGAQISDASTDSTLPAGSRNQAMSGPHPRWMPRSSPISS